MAFPYTTQHHLQCDKNKHSRLKRFKWLQSNVCAAFEAPPKWNNCSNVELLIETDSCFLNTNVPSPCFMSISTSKLFNQDVRHSSAEDN